MNGPCVTRILCNTLEETKADSIRQAERKAKSFFFRLQTGLETFISSRSGLHDESDMGDMRLHLAVRWHRRVYLIVGLY